MTTWCRFEKDNQVSYGVVDGDTVEIEISGIRVLRNRVVAAK
jgi:hypothetical protein